MNNYISNPTPTFCMELFYLKNNNKKLGWFLRDDLKTDTYIFTWIHKSKYIIQNNNKLLTNYNDIDELEIMILNKIDILKYFSKIGITREMLIFTENIFNSTNKIYFDYYNKNFTYNKSNIGFTKSIYLPEQPINIVVNKKIWKEISAAHYIIKKSSIEIKKENYIYKNKYYNI